MKTKKLKQRLQTLLLLSVLTIGQLPFGAIPVFSETEPPTSTEQTGEEVYSEPLEVVNDLSILPDVAPIITAFNVQPYTNLLDANTHYVTVDKGTLQALLPLPTTLKATAQGGEVDGYTVKAKRWECVGKVSYAADYITEVIDETTTYDANVSGIYRFKPILTLDEGVSLADGVTPPTVDVVISQDMPVNPLATAVIDMADNAPQTSGTGWTFSNGIYTILDGADVTITGQNDNQRRIEVEEGATANITLDGVTINNLDGKSPLLLKNGANVNLRVNGNNMLFAGNDCAGIQAPYGTTLTIDGSGILTAKGGGGYGTGNGVAGIGGGVYEGNGVIIINGATLTVTGGWQSAGLGAGCGFGHWNTAGDITINGGTINAAGSDYSPAIGGPRNYDIGGINLTIRINGGIVNAGNELIGSCDRGEVFNWVAGTHVIIRGGMVTAGKIGAESTTITGGNVKINGFDGDNSGAPKNDAGELLHLNTLTVGIPAIQDGVTITSALIDGFAAYGTQDVKTLDSGKLYFWLPETDNFRTEVQTGNGVYYGNSYDAWDNMSATLKQLTNIVTLTQATVAGGASNVSDSTALTLMFDAAYPSLQASDIKLSKSCGLGTPTTVDNGLTWTVPITSVSEQGSLTVGVRGKDLTGVIASPKNAGTVYKDNRTVAVGSQNHATNIGGTVTFPVTTEHFIDGDYSVTFNGEIPTGLSIDNPAGKITLTDNSGELTLSTAAQFISGTYHLTIKIDGKESNELTLIVGELVSYLDANGATQTVAALPLLNTDTNPGDGWFVLKGTENMSEPLVSGENTHIILADGCDWTFAQGIDVAGEDWYWDDDWIRIAEKKLTFYGQSTGTQMGKLTANGRNGEYSPGIGRFYGGSVVINGGQLTAKGGSMAYQGAPGISGASVVINGGRVTATSGNGRYLGDSGISATTIVINGGRVTADGGQATENSEDNFALGIGESHRSDTDSWQITITGGEVIARGQGQAPGIGSYDTWGTGALTITGGTIIAQRGAESQVGDIIGNSFGIGEVKVIITGGSIKADNGIDPQATNAEDAPVYLNTLTVGNPAQTNTALTSANFADASYYGIKDVKTDDTGKLYVWLPTTSEAKLAEVKTADNSFAKIYQRETSENTHTLPSSMPTVAIDYINENLTGFVNGGVYRFNGGYDVEMTDTTEYAIRDVWFGNTISIVRVDLSSDPQFLTIPDRPATPIDLNATDCSMQGKNDGTIKGLPASSTAYEIKKDNGSYTDTVVNAASEITDLAAGIYYVRVKAVSGDSGNFASVATSGLVIAEGDASQPTIYTVTDHFGTWTGAGTLKARVDADHTKFVRLLSNGQEVDRKNYTITAGSTIITLSENYLKTYEIGTHTLTAEFTDGVSEAIKLKVAATPNSQDDKSLSEMGQSKINLPTTGDNTTKSIWTGLLLLAIFFTSSYRWLRRNKYLS